MQLFQVEIFSDRSRSKTKSNDPVPSDQLFWDNLSSYLFPFSQEMKEKRLQTHGMIYDKDVWRIMKAFSVCTLR